MKYKIYNLKKYNICKNLYDNDFNTEFFEGNIHEITNELENHKGYHLRLKGTDNVIFFGDLDKYTNDIEIFKKELHKFLEDEYSLSFNIENEFFYTQNYGYKKIGKSYHFSIPKFCGNIKTIKKIMDNFKIKFNYNEEIDRSIYSDKWFRLPNQLKENENNTEHIIIKGTMKDFIVTNIENNSKNIDFLFLNEDNDNISVLSEISLDTNLKNNISLHKFDDKSIVNEVNYKNELYEKADLIDIKYINSYNDWTKIIWSLKSDNIMNKDLALYITKKSYLFKDEDFFLKTWNFYNKENLKISIGTFNYYAKISNNQEYIKIKAKYNYKNIDEVLRLPTQENIAKCFYKISGEDFIYHQNSVYYFNGIVWESSNTSLRRKFVTEFTNIFINHNIEILNQLKNLDNENNNERIGLLEKNEKINKIINLLQTNKHIKDICNDAIKIYIENNNIEFEKNPNIFCFNNAVYDLEKCDFLIAPNKFDYMNLTTGYDYREPIIDEINYLKDIIEKVFPIENERILYLIILSTGLYGKTLEKFILANGSGRNGKGFINELAQHTLGDYAYNCANSILLNSIEGGGANQAISNMNNKRLIFYREPDNGCNKKLNDSTIKELTGGSEINARELYSKKTVTKLKGTHILECNKRPKISGETDPAIQMRLINQEFKSTFTNEDNLIDETNYIFKGNDSLKESSFKEKYRYAFFHILIEHWKLFLDKNKNIEFFIPKNVKEQSEIYLKDSNEIFSWFDENYEKIDDETSIIKIDDIFENYTKIEKRDKNKRYFLEYFSKNIFLKKYFKERERRKNIVDIYNVSELKNILFGFKKKIFY